MQLVFATQNLGKLREVQLLMPSHIELLSLSDIGCVEPLEETQSTIKGNAVQKALYIKEQYGLNCFADDTGLEVDELDGAPGVFSARYAGPEANANANMKKLLAELYGKTNRSAAFKTVIALTLNSGLHTFTGICKGQITQEGRGNSGFGYDPIFQPDGFSETFGEMDLEIKNRISHRSKAIVQLIEFLRNP